MSAPSQHPQSHAQQVTPNGKPITDQPDTKKPWYTKWWVITIAVILALGFISSLLGGGKKDEAPEPVAQSEEIVEVVEEPQSLGAAPNQVGELLPVAQANLELEGYEVESVSDSGKGIWDKGNWEVIEQKQNGNKVLLTVTSTVTPATTDKNDDEPGIDTPATSTTTEETNSQGLTGDTALYACANLWETALKNEYPASKIKIHSIIGVLAQRLDDDDSWFIKIEGKIDKNLINVECSVYGSEDYPDVIPLAAY